MKEGTEQSETVKALLVNADFSAWKDRMEVGAKAVLAFVATAYVAGLLILNFHVREFGLNYLHFLQIEYVLVGVLWIFLLSAAYVAGMTIFKWTLNLWYSDVFHRNKWISRSIAVLLAALMLASALFFFSTMILERLSDHDLKPLTKDWYFAMGALAINTLFVAVCIKLIRRFFEDLSHAESEDHRLQSKLWDDRFMLTGNLVTLVFGFSVYAHFIYPFLSPSYGGGKFQKVEFILKEDARVTMNSLGYRFLPESRNVGEQKVIFEASDFFLIVPPLGHNEKVKAIRLRKEMVDAVFHLSNK